MPQGLGLLLSPLCHHEGVEFPPYMCPSWPPNESCTSNDMCIFQTGSEKKRLTDQVYFYLGKLKLSWMAHPTDLPEVLMAKTVPYDCP